ncbi:hypothetical protein MMC13_000525 [Lambiella insularis]|nr:hypothetical protein [Lambiella insularis]
MRWRTGLGKAGRNEKGKIVLNLDDGTTVTVFKLVVDADGTWSKVRSLPKFSGVFYLTGLITYTNPFYPKVVKMAKEGPMILMARETNIWNQRQGDGHYRCDLGFLRPENFATDGSFDITNNEAVKNIMLTDEFFGLHAPDI